MKTLKFLLVGAVALMAFAGCENTDELVDTTPVYDDAYYASYASISSSDSGFTSNSTGGAIHFKVEGGEVKVLVSCGTDWLVQNDNPANFNAYASDSYYLTVSAEQNYVEEELTGTITLTTAEMHIAFASITVTQNAYGAPEITVSSNEWHAPAVGKLTTTITVDSDTEWTVEGGDEWLTVEKSGTGINLTAEENEDTEERDTKIVLTCTDGYKSDSETITVTQDGLAYITLSEEELSLPQFGDTVSIKVESNFDYECTYDSDWLKIEKDEDAAGLAITYTTNETGEERGCTVALTAGDSASNVAKAELAITQAAHSLTVETTEWHAPAVGELKKEIGVEAPADWSAEAKVDWLTVEKTEKGITLTAKENSETNRREGEVVLSCTDGVNSSSETITVMQDGLAYISLSEEELLFSKLASSASITVESNFDWDYSYDTTNDWLVIEKDAEESSLKITYTENETGSDREVVVIITAGDGAENLAEAKLSITQSCENTDALILEYTITSSSTEINLPIRDFTNATIDWDDGTTETTSSDNPSHRYTTPGIYTITINGTVKKLSSFNYSSSTITGATYLTAVKQWGNTGLTSMENAFRGCTRLKSLPEYTNGAFINVETFYFAFYNCSSLVSAPSFEGCSNVTTFEDTFCGCTSLTTVPEEMFSGCTAVTSFYRTFYNLTDLTNAPSFDGCSSATMFAETFSGCTSLTTIPEKMFSGCTAATSFSQTFYNCSSLTSAPSFEGCSNVTTFKETFSGCTALTTIPENMFSGCSAAKTFECAFNSCSSLTSAPSFEECSSVTSFGSTFSGCTSLTTVPENMFSGCTAVTSFSQTFCNCSFLTSVPSFEACMAVTSFVSTFYGCSALTTVPETIFIGHTAVTDFSSCFRDCSSLTSAPSFEGLSSVTSFHYTFYACTALTTVPENIFSGCTAVKSFRDTFDTCSSLKGVPISLFDDCLLCTDFNYTFSGCSSVSGESPYTEVDVNGETVKVHLYNRSSYAAYLRCLTPIYYGKCFRDTTFSDIDSIPSGWK